MDPTCVLVGEDPCANVRQITLLAYFLCVWRKFVKEVSNETNRMYAFYRNRKL